jgi:hypothetical protein
MMDATRKMGLQDEIHGSHFLIDAFLGLETMSISYGNFSA